MFQSLRNLFASNDAPIQGVESTPPPPLEGGAKAVGDSADDWIALTQGAVVNGVAVTPTSAMGEAGVYGAVKMLSEDLAKIKLRIYRVTGKTANDRRREVANTHPLFRVLSFIPNSWQSPLEFIEYMELNRQLSGNAYALLYRNRRGQISDMLPIRATRVTVLEADDGSIFYTVAGGGSFENAQVQRMRDLGLMVDNNLTVPAEHILHLRNMPIGSGLMGQSPISAARGVVSLALGQQKHSEGMMSNSARPSGVLQHPGKLSPEGATRLRNAWERLYKGADNSGRTAVLEQGVEFKPVSMNAVDAQFVEQRKLSLLDIARIFRIPPTKLMDTSNATYSNSEQEALAYVIDSLMPIVEKWESALERQLLSPREWGRYEIEFETDALLRGDIKARFSSYASGRQWGILTSNEARQREGLNPVEGGDVLLEPLNMWPMGQERPQSANTTGTGTGDTNNGGDQSDDEAGED